MMHHDIPAQRPITPLLDAIDHPQQLKNLSVAQLQQLADELRHYLLYAAGQSGGHFGANLGVVELTIALHTCLNTPEDRLVWDVGHQAYAHKVLTGRREQLPSIRAQHGLTAFPTRSESVFDTFGVGHSSTSISAALGMALAVRDQTAQNQSLQNQSAQNQSAQNQSIQAQSLPSRRVACVIGDGAMTAGMAFEAMNDAVQHQADVLVVLNDNDMSISGSVGGFSRHLAAIWQDQQQITLDDQGGVVQRERPAMAFRSRQAAPHCPDNLFKAIGFEYFGPLDGHDLPELLRVLHLLKDRKGPRLLHVYTTKGKGFAPAEADQIAYHAIAKIPPLTAQNANPVNKPASQPVNKPQKYSDVFGQFLCDLAAQDSRMLAITPAMCEGSGMVPFAAQYPTRFFDVAIAEQHALTLAAGMACEGSKPIVAIYSTFLQRGYDQLVHDIALQNLDVTFAIDRAGLVGEDGPTHAGAFDYAFMRTLPNMVIMAPKDENECRHMLYSAYQHHGPAAVRYPRGAGSGSSIDSAFQLLPLGESETLADLNPTATQKVALLAFGSMVLPALAAAEQLVEQQLTAQGLRVLVVNMRFIKPLDQAKLAELTAQHWPIVTIEEHAVMAGAGSAVNEALHGLLHRSGVLNLGLPDRFIDHAAHASMLAECGLNAQCIAQSVAQWLQKLQ